ncbi:hypothetical protein EYF80_062574 [Liparis tanakae]|uniref:Uncharacterized protein n=1 Tax=Liparis tanakae TaxID=230148 RepID=A0A4Z2EEW5_9TELE|nr:hypothetical protein EYF80_062574 [Liparis tanakae]
MKSGICLGGDGRDSQAATLQRNVNRKSGSSPLATHFILEYTHGLIVFAAAIFVLPPAAAPRVSFQPGY